MNLQVVSAKPSPHNDDDRTSQPDVNEAKEYPMKDNLVMEIEKAIEWLKTIKEEVSW